MESRRKAVVTGGASGIGAATVLELARQGYDVVAVDMNSSGAEAVVQSALASGGRHRAICADVADDSAMVSTFREAHAFLGGLDALATCAGVADVTPFMSVSAAAFRRVHDVNVIGTFLCIREAARYMEPGGRVCTIASVAGLRGGGLMGTVAYASSKGAVLALTKNAARALAEKGISVNSVAPGATLTPMIAEPWKDAAFRGRVESLAAQNRTAAPDEIARTVAFLLSPAASYIDGATLVADGGLVMY